MKRFTLEVLTIFFATTDPLPESFANLVYYCTRWGMGGLTTEIYFTGLAAFFVYATPALLLAACLAFTHKPANKVFPVLFRPNARALVR